MLLMVLATAFCPACGQECCIFGCYIEYHGELDTDNGVYSKYIEMEVRSVKECRQVVEDVCGKPAAEKRWREIDDPSRYINWDKWAPWDITDYNWRCHDQEVVRFCWDD